MRFPTLKNLVFAFPVALVAQTPDLKMGVVYQCPAVQATMQVFSCTGTGPSDTCDVQTAPQGRPPMRGKSTRPQVMALFTLCQLPAAARGGPGGPQGQSGAGGFKVGDRVRVLASGRRPSGRAGSCTAGRRDKLEASHILPQLFLRVARRSAQETVWGSATPFPVPDGIELQRRRRTGGSSLAPRLVPARRASVHSIPARAIPTRAIPTGAISSRRAVPSRTISDAGRHTGNSNSGDQVPQKAIQG